MPFIYGESLSFFFIFFFKGVSLRLVWWFFYKNKTHYIHDLYALMKMKRNMREIFVCVLFFSTSHTKRIIIIYPNEPLLCLYKHIHPFMKCHSTLDSGNHCQMLWPVVKGHPFSPRVTLSYGLKFNKKQQIRKSFFFSCINLNSNLLTYIYI